MIILKKNVTFFLVSDEKRVRFKSVNLLKSLNSNAMIELIKDTRDTYTDTHTHTFSNLSQGFFYLNFSLLFHVVIQIRTIKIKLLNICTCWIKSHKSRNKWTNSSKKKCLVKQFCFISFNDLNLFALTYFIPIKFLYCTGIWFNFIFNR